MECLLVKYRITVVIGYYLLDGLYFGLYLVINDVGSYTIDQSMYGVYALSFEFVAWIGRLLGSVETHSDQLGRLAYWLVHMLSIFCSISKLLILLALIILSYISLTIIHMQ